MCQPAVPFISESVVFDLVNGNEDTVFIEDEVERLAIEADPTEIREGQQGTFTITPDTTNATICGNFRLVIDANADNSATPPGPNGAPPDNWPVSGDTVDYGLSSADVLPSLSLSLYDQSQPTSLKYKTEWLHTPSQLGVPEVVIDVSALNDHVLEQDEIIDARVEIKSKDSAGNEIGIETGSDTMTILGPDLAITAIEDEAWEPFQKLFCPHDDIDGLVRVESNNFYDGSRVRIDITGAANFDSSDNIPDDYVIHSISRHAYTDENGVQHSAHALVGSEYSVGSNGLYLEIDEGIFFAPIEFVIEALQDNLDPGDDNESATEDAIFTLQYNGRSATVNIKDPDEQVELSADPAKIMEGKTGEFIVRPSGDVPAGTELCTNFRLIIDASLDNAATPPVPSTWWPFGDPNDPQYDENKETVDYDLSPGTPLAQHDETAELYDFETEWISAQDVAEARVEVKAYVDKYIEGEEVVFATLQTQDDGQTDFDTYNSDDITIEDRVLDADLEWLLKPDKDSSCSCSCSCNSIKADLASGTAIVMLDTVIPHQPEPIGDGPYNQSPIVRVKFELPPLDGLPGEELPDSIEATFTIIKLDPDDEDEEVELGSKSGFTFPLDPNIQPGMTVAAAVQLHLFDLLAAADLETGSYQIEMVAVGHYDNGIPDDDVPAPAWHIEEPYYYRQLDDGTFAPAFEIPGHKRLVWARTKTPVELSGDGAANQSAAGSPGERKYLSATGFVVYRSDNSASFYESNGDGTYKRPAETLSELNDSTADEQTQLTARWDALGLTTLPDPAPISYTLKHRYGNKDFFDEDGLYVALMDRNGNAVFFIRDGESRVEYVVNPLGRVTTFSYPAAGQVIVTDFAQRQVVYNYAAPVLTITYPDPDGGGPKASPMDRLTYGGPFGLRFESFERTDTAGSASQLTTLHYEGTNFDPNDPEIFDDRLTGITWPDGSHWKIMLHRMREGVSEPSQTPLFYQPATADDTSFDAFFTNEAVIIDGEDNETRYILDHRGRAEKMTKVRKEESDLVYVYDLIHTEDNDRGEVDLFTAPDPDGPQGPLGELVTDPTYMNGNITLQVLPPLAGQDSFTLDWSYNDDYDRPTGFINELSHLTTYDVDPENGNVTKVTMFEPSADPGAPRPLISNPWQNGHNPLDVDDDGFVSSTDALVVINQLNLPNPPNLASQVVVDGNHAYYDVDGDFYIAPSDVLLIINYLNNPNSGIPSGNYDDGLTGNVEIEYQYTTPVSAYPGSGKLLPFGLIWEETVHTGRDIDGDGANDSLITRYDYYDSTEAAIGSASYGLLQYVTFAYGTDEETQVEYRYDGFGNPSLIIDELERETELFYDDLNRLVGTIAPDPDDNGDLLPPAVKYDYDPFDNVLAVEQINHRPLVGSVPEAVTSHVTTFEYDGMNRTTKVVAPHPDNVVLAELVGGTNVNSNATLETYVNQPFGPPPGEAGHPVTVMTYDRNGNLDSVNDPLGRVTKYSYNELNRLEVVVSPNPGDSHFDDPREIRYDADNPEPVAKYEPLPENGGLITRFAYDNIGNLRSATDALGHQVFYRYDAWSRIVDVVAPRTDLKLSGPQVTQLTNGIAADDVFTGGNFEHYSVPVTQFDYEATDYGWRQSVTDPLERVSTQQFDFAGRLRYVVEPEIDGAAPVTWFDYFQDGAAKATIDVYGNATEYEYDAKGRLSDVLQAFVRDPNSAPSTFKQPTTSFTYDDANQLVQVSDPLGRVTSYAYDQLGRQIQVTPPDPDGAGSGVSPTMGYVYDAVGNVLQVTDALNHSTRYEYDSLFRRTKTTDAIGQPTEFTFDLVGNLKTLTDSNDNATSWVYDRFDRVHTETNVFGDARTYEYDAASNLRHKTDRNGRVTTYEYDNLYRLTDEVWHGSPSRALTFEYDLVGNLREVSDPAATYTFEYDNRYRLDVETQDIIGLSGLITLDHDYDLVVRPSEHQSAIPKTSRRPMNTIIFIA
jgi:YD repeat-containing protein